MKHFQQIIQEWDDETLDEFVKLCEKIARSNGSKYFGPHRELTLGLVHRAGDLYEARELGESDLELAAMFASEISGIPMDLLLVGWAIQAAAREQQNRKHEGAS